MFRVAEVCSGTEGMNAFRLVQEWFQSRMRPLVGALNHAHDDFVDCKMSLTFVKHPDSGCKRQYRYKSSVAHVFDERLVTVEWCKDGFFPWTT